MYTELSLCFTTLILAIVAGKPVPEINTTTLTAIWNDLKTLKDVPEGSGLYTPNITERACAREIIECFKKEIGAIIKENEDNKKITETIEKIQRNIHNAWNLEQMKRRGLICPQDAPQRKTHEFLEEMVKYIQNCNAHQNGTQF